MGAEVMSAHPHRFDEERAPCGKPSLEWIYYHYSFIRPAPDLSDCLAARPAAHPWRLCIWEPLPTKAPGPHLAHAYCCYINTVKFYHRPYIVDEFTRFYRANGKLRPSKGGFLEWDEVSTRLTWDDLVRFEGETFKKGVGTVVWSQGRWWMRHGARRERKESS